MKKSIINELGFGYVAHTIVEVGRGGDYSNLSSAVSDIEAGILSGDIELQVISDITETSAITINKLLKSFEIQYSNDAIQWVKLAETKRNQTDNCSIGDLQYLKKNVIIKYLFVRPMGLLLFQMCHGLKQRKSEG